MSDSAEMVVRKFFAAFPQSDVDELISFFGDRAVYIDGPRGIHRGVDDIRAEFEVQVQMVPSTAVDIKSLVTDGHTVMVERGEQFVIQGKPVDHEVVDVFEVDDGHITRWRDYYDLTSLAERVVAVTAD